MTRQVAPPRWHREVDAEPVVVGELRRGVADFARAHGADDDVVDNIALAVSEAVTNAIIHAFVGRQAGHVALTAEAGEGSILVRVLDDGRGMTPHPESPGLGLGLTMMASMATRCDIRQGPGRQRHRGAARVRRARGQRPGARAGRGRRAARAAGGGRAAGRRRGLAGRGRRRARGAAGAAGRGRVHARRRRRERASRGGWPPTTRARPGRRAPPSSPAGSRRASRSTSRSRRCARAARG